VSDSGARANSAITGPATPAVRYFLGVDVGGTFTDVVIGDSSGGVAVTKVTTTTEDPREGVARGVAELLVARGVDPGAVTRLVHGTTLATNVIQEQAGSDIAFVTSAGFGDLLRLGREFRQEDERFDLFFQVPPSPVPRHRTFEIQERVDARGEVLRPLDEGELAELTGVLAATGVRAVAICLLHSYQAPGHEQKVADACRAALGPDVFVVTSSEVWPELREYERAMTTVMCAYVGPVMTAYLAGLEGRLAELGVRCPIEIMESSGGVMSASLAARRPIYTVESGGAAGVIAAGFLGVLVGASQVLSLDIGGTTAKAGIVRRGRPDITHDFHVGGPGVAGSSRARSIYPVKIPVVDMAEVGSGGGSIASVDSGGALRVGPRSAGSVPGPACYGRGGTEPTVTDANLLLGYLRPGPLSGGISLDPTLSEIAIQAAISDPLGLDVLAAARAVHDIANATMAAAIRMVTVQRGIDPRQFVMVAFGGAGPMHAAELAGTFAVPTVLVPHAAGVASALGLIASDLTVDRVRTQLLPLDPGSGPAVAAVYSELEALALAELPPADAGDEEGRVDRTVDVRYRGQAHQLTVPAPGGPVTESSIAAIGRDFAEQYQATYGIARGAPTEMVNFRVRVTRTVEKLTVRPQGEAAEWHAAVPIGERPVLFSGGLDPCCPVYRWADLEPGMRIGSPSIVEGADTTVVAPPGCRVELDRWRNLVLHQEDGR
jgi:N-methylhydantoinase A